MQRVEASKTAVTLKETTSNVRLKHIPPGRAVAIIMVLALVFRVINISLLSLFVLIDKASVFTTIIQAINNLSYVLMIPVAIVVYAVARNQEADSLILETIANILRNRSAIIGLSVISLLIIAGDFAPYIATHDPIQSMIGIPGEVPPLPRKAPCIPLFGCHDPTHILGLDKNGRDMFSRIIFGARVSLSVGVSSVLAAVLTGSCIGLIAGYASGWWDNGIMRFMDVLLAFPSLLLAISIVTILGPGLQNALLAISVVSIPVYARLARASVLSVKELDFVVAERALGAPPSRILFGQILPNTLTPLIVNASLDVGGAVLTAAGLSFLGLGAQPPTPEWGAMLSEARNDIFTAPHLVFFPGIAIMLTVLGFNLLGDGIRDALDPRTSRK